MKSYRILFLIMLSIAGLTSCGNDDDDDNSSADRQEEKNLFSRWVSNNGNAVLDLRGHRFNVRDNFPVVFSDGTTCSCQIRITGTQNSGEADLLSCFYSGGGNGDPGCTQFNGTSSYTKDEDTLRVCDSTCADYR